MEWIKVEKFEEVLERFKKDIEESKVEDLDELKSGFLWWDERYNQYVYLKVIIDQIIDEEYFKGRLVWVGNGLTAYTGYFEIESRDHLIYIINNIEEYFDFE